MGERRKRVGSTERLSWAEAKRKYSVQLTGRDIAILKWLKWLQALTTEQISRPFFPGNWSTCTKRLQKLFQNRYIWRYQIDLHQLGFKDGPQETLLHTLDEAGAKVLAQQLGVPVETIWKPSDRKVNEQHLYHTIVNNNVRIAVKLAVEALGFTVEQWETDESFRRKPVDQRWVVDFMPAYDGAEVETNSEIIPDDFLTIVTPSRRYHCIIEIDTGAEVRQPQQRPRGKDTSLSTKVRRYISFFHKEKRNEPSLFEKITGQEQKGIRVFFITTGTDKAVDNLLAAIKQSGGKSSYWVARYDLAKQESLILHRPIFRKASESSPTCYLSIGMSKVEELRHRLQQYGVEARDIETCVSRITDLAREQLSDGWNERERGMSLDQGVALRADELAEAVLQRFEKQIGGEGEEAKAG